MAVHYRGPVIDGPAAGLENHTNEIQTCKLKGARYRFHRDGFGVSIGSEKTVMESGILIVFGHWVLAQKNMAQASRTIDEFQGKSETV